MEVTGDDDDNLDKADDTEDVLSHVSQYSSIVDGQHCWAQSATTHPNHFHVRYEVAGQVLFSIMQGRLIEAHLSTGGREDRRSHAKV